MKNLTTQTDSAIAEVIKKSLTLAEKTGNFVIDQAPDLIKEFYRWHISCSIIFIITSIIIAIFMYRVPFLWLDKEEGCSDFKYFGRWGDDGAIAAWIIFCFGIIISLCMFIVNVYDFIFILTAPKLYLIEYFVK